MKKSLVTQRMVNGFPDWSSIRSDEQSLGFQLANVMSLKLEELDRQLSNIGSNYNLVTANLDEIDLVYAFDLDPTFNFTTNTTDTSSINYVTPTVSGLIGTTWYSVSGTSDNNIESFWYNSIPTRFTSTETNSNTYVVLSGTNLLNTPTTLLNQAHQPGKLFVTISGGTSFLSIENNEPLRGTVILEGLTRRGLTETETLIFLYNDTKPTMKEWDKVERVHVYGINPLTTATISIRSANYNLGPYLDFYNMEFSPNREKVDTFWNIGTTVSGHSTLDLIRYTSDNFRNLLAGVTDKEIVRSCELLNSSGVNIVAKDIALVPFSQKAWICTSNELFLYDLDQYYPAMNKMAKKQYDSIVKIQPDNYHKLLGDSVNLTYLFARPTKSLAKHRVTIQKPSGSTYAIVAGTLVSNIGDTWQYGQNTDKTLRADDIVTLDQRGDFIITLEAVMSDLSTYIDQVIISTESKTPLAKFFLPFIATGITVDSNQKLWIIDNLGTQHRIDLATDTMLVDFDQKVIYFKEQYDAVSVIA